MADYDRITDVCFVLPHFWQFVMAAVESEWILGWEGHVFVTLYIRTNSSLSTDKQGRGKGMKTAKTELWRQTGEKPPGEMKEVTDKKVSCPASLSWPVFLV